MNVESIFAENAMPKEPFHMEIEIRLESERDYETVEELTRETFWNVYAPGADEHFLVHRLRKSPDFIAKLDFVAVVDGRIAGSIMYSKSCVLDRTNQKHDTITFGPLSVLPDFQNQGVGKKLIEHSVKTARELGYRAVLTHGYPHYYCRRGFRSSRDFGIGDLLGRFPFSLLVLELFEGALNGGIQGRFHQSDVF